MNPACAVTLVDAVEKSLYEYICRNRMNQGDVFPREEELAKALKVSRNIVREALSRLRMLGLVETRKKRGMTLSQPDAFVGLERMVENGFMSPEYRSALIEMRLILELGMSDYVFYHHTSEELADLEAIIAGEGSATSEELEEIDIRFHTRLFEMSGNPVLKRLQAILRPFFKNAGSAPRNPHNAVPPDHRDICTALRHGTAEEFRQIMHRHLNEYFVID